MNVFYLDSDPKIAARYHVDKHFKMILESGQLLSTAIRLKLGTNTKLRTPSGNLKTVYLLPNESYHWEKKVKKDKVSYSFKSDSGLYVQTHVNHPCAKWVRKCFGNFNYVYTLMLALDRERCFRLKIKTSHKTASQMKNANILHLATVAFPNISPSVTHPSLAMPNYCKIYEDPVDCYRKYYREEKSHLHKWTRRNVPYWV